MKLSLIVLLIAAALWLPLISAIKLEPQHAVGDFYAAINDDEPSTTPMHETPIVTPSQPSFEHGPLLHGQEPVDQSPHAALDESEFETEAIGGGYGRGGFGRGGFGRGGFGYGGGFGRGGFYGGGFGYGRGFGGGFYGGYGGFGGGFPVYGGYYGYPYYGGVY